MGNSTSAPTRPAPQRNPSTSPKPGDPHSSMKTKKRSLELPDLASLMLTSTQPTSRGRQGPATKSAAISIPTQPRSQFDHYRQAVEPPGYSARPKNRIDSMGDLMGPFPSGGGGGGGSSPPSSSGRAPSAPRGRQQPMSQKAQAQHAQMQKLQDLYNASQQPTSHDPHLAGIDPENASPSERHIQEVVHSSIPIHLGKNREGAAEDVAPDHTQSHIEDPLADPVTVKIVWNGGGKNVLLARAGDDEWKGRQPMIQEGPNTWTATVMLRPGTHHVRFMVDGTWRVADDLLTAVDDQGSLANYVAVPIPFIASPSIPTALASSPPVQTVPPRKLQPGQSFWSADSSADGENDDSKTSHPKEGQTPHQHLHHIVSQAKWTNVLPPELIEAARQEEEYLTASTTQYENGPQQQRVAGFVPAPHIPPAPTLPRHLEKLILNSKVTGNTSGGNGGSSAASGVGSGQGGRERREKKDRKEERDRERTSRRTRGNVPPPPPPSEDGHGEEEETIGPLPTDTYTQTQSGPSSAAASAANSATHTPSGSGAPTPTGPLSPSISPGTSRFTSDGTGSPSTNVPAAMGSRTITLDTATLPALTDDASVLPVPSHVVLHHLSTSAIRNGVLAVGNTTRYRKKYLTTVYYKPT